MKKINIDSHRNRNYNLYSFNVSIPHFFFFSITGSNTTILQQDYSKIYRYTFLRLYFSITGELVDKCTIHGITMDAVQLFLVLLASSRYFLHPIGKSTHNNPNLKLRFIRLIASSRYNRDNSWEEKENFFQIFQRKPSKGTDLNHEEKEEEEEEET